MISALGQNNCYIHYISAIWEGPLHVTAELIKMVQYHKKHHGSGGSRVQKSWPVPVPASTHTCNLHGLPLLAANASWWFLLGQDKKKGASPPWVTSTTLQKQQTDVNLPTVKLLSSDPLLSRHLLKVTQSYLKVHQNAWNMTSKTIFF